MADQEDIAEFLCECDELVRSACRTEVFFREYKGKKYCVLHFPGTDKTGPFKIALKRKLDSKDFDLRGVWFPEDACFQGFEFNETTSFFMATFTRVANFQKAKFKVVADFDLATFSADADFRSATFSESAYFREATFSTSADFGFATFEDRVRFSGSEDRKAFKTETSLDLQFSSFERPERVFFHNVMLRVHWFVNVDPTRFEFIDVEWCGALKTSIISKEVELLKKKLLPGPSASNEKATSERLMTIACRRLAANAEESRDYASASQFRYWSMDLQRRQGWRGTKQWSLTWLYWLGSGYGERILQASIVLAGILLFSGYFYTKVGFVRPETKTTSDVTSTQETDRVGTPQGLGNAAFYSAYVITLQKPDPRPLTNWAKFVVLAETILGPVQAALLALAIRRRFMR